MSAPKEPTAVAPLPEDSNSAGLVGDPTAPESATADDASADESAGSGSKTERKRRLFGLGKRKDEDKAAATKNSGPTSSPTSQDFSMNVAPISPLISPGARQASVSPHGSPPTRGAMASPPQQRYRSASPALRSPASSQIFERNVQEGTLSGEMSPAIPAHIQTEDHIPPVLEASSLAITDDHLNPDEVEIVMHTAHQPAAASVAASGGESLASPLLDEPPPSASVPISHQETDDSASNYGSLDPGDVRRLSFISFADVVQAEHVDTSRDSVHLMSLSSTTHNRSPSPVRSPASSHDVGTPPTSGAASMHGMDASQSKSSRVAASPPQLTGSLSMGSELTIETMRQALDKTGGGDYSGTRSPPLSAASPDEASAEQSFKT